MPKSTTWKLQCFRCSTFSWLVIAVNAYHGYVSLWHVNEDGNVIEYKPTAAFPDLRQFHPCGVESVPAIGRARIRSVVESRTGQVH